MALYRWSTGSAATATPTSSQVTTRAHQHLRHGLANLKTPIFLRWYYESEFPGSPNYANCIGADGPHGHQLAFQHIDNLFDAAGATDLAFVWAIARGGAQDGLPAITRAQPMSIGSGLTATTGRTSIAAAQDAVRREVLGVVQRVRILG